MLILHTVWHKERCYAWGEQRLQGPVPVAQKAHPCSPFSADEATILTALTRILTHTTPDPSDRATLMLYLPAQMYTVAGASHCIPVPSQPFLLSGEQAEITPLAEPRPFCVSAIGCSWPVLLELVTQPREYRLAANLFAGHDLLRLSELFRYAGALVARGRYLPGIRFAQHGERAVAEARWQPCFDFEENGRLNELVARMPNALFATHAVPDRTRQTELILETWIDWIVRSSVVTMLSRAQAERGQFYSVHDAWFAALRGASSTIRWDNTAELEALHDSIIAWRSPIAATRSSDERPVFTLHIPQSPETPWFLEILAPQNTQHVTQTFLLVLGQAALIFPVLGTAHLYPQGFGCQLEPSEAHLFLTHAAALLRAAGFIVDIPEMWAHGMPAGLTLSAEVTPLDQPPEDPNSVTPDARVAIHWNVTCNGEVLSQEEINTLLHAESPLVFFRGTWMTIDPTQLQHALRISKHHTDSTETALDAIQLSLGTSGLRHGLAVSSVRGHGWVEALLNRLSGSPQAFETTPVPPEFHGELRPYQHRGFSWLVYLRSCGFGACLADDMGLGKTVQALAFLLHCKAKQSAHKPTLIVGPLSILGNWMHEAARFAPTLACHLHHGAWRWHGDSFAREMQHYDVVITSYAMLHRDYTDLRKVNWSCIILDEAQNIKNPDTRQSQVARALPADYRIALTGTPIENHVGEVWSLMDFLNPGMLGKRAVFREAFFRPIQTGTDPGARTRLRRVTAPFILRRVKTDRAIIQDLPEKIETRVYCPLTPEQIELYQDELASFRRAVAESQGIQRRGLILAVLTRLKQICNHPSHYLKEAQDPDREHQLVADDFSARSGKLTRLVDQLEEIFENNESALIFTQYAQMGELLAQHLCQTFGCEVPFLHGGLQRKAREAMIQKFQTSKRPMVFVLSLKAGGTGLNLTRASHVFHYDRWWNPAVENQATDRAFRIGQDKRVVVHKFICNGTLEDRIDALIESKSSLAAEIITQGEHALTELSDDALQELLALREDIPLEPRDPS